MSDWIFWALSASSIFCLIGWLVCWRCLLSFKKFNDEKDAVISEKVHIISDLDLKLQACVKEKEEAQKEGAKFQGNLEAVKNMQGELRAQMKNEFANISRELLDKSSKLFAEHSQERVQGLLKPFAQNLEGFQKRVNEIHDANIKNFGSMEKSIEQVRQTGKAMSEEAESLTQALKGNKQLLGAWGEMQLETTLQSAGMIEGTHYQKQASYQDSERVNKRLDFVVNLPKNKHIVIDAKTTLNSFIDMSEAADEQEREQARLEFVQATKRHIDGLSSKDYHAIAEIDSPMYVLMYIPLESAYFSLLQTNMSVFDDGYKKNIILVSHTTLLPILRTVSNLWMMEESSANARSILGQAGGIYKQLLTVTRHLNTLGGRINSATKSYNELLTSFNGQQGLVKKVDKFRTLSDKSREDPVLAQPLSQECLNSDITESGSDIALDELPEPAGEDTGNKTSPHI